MSERYCSRDAHIPTSSQIIREYYLHKQNFLLPNEIHLLKAYCLCESAYLHLYTHISMFGICPIQELNNEQAELLIKNYKTQLTELEDSTEMRNFFSRIKDKDFIMCYGKHKNTNK